MDHPMFRTKPVGELIAASQGERPLKRVLKTHELVILGVGAVIGTGIFVLPGGPAPQVIWSKAELAQD